MSVFLLAGMLRSQRAHLSERRQAGFTLTELLIVVVILGILAAIATPSLTRDSHAMAGRVFANELLRELQKARAEALGERLPVRAFFYSGRVELRSWLPPGAGLTSPTAPTAADPLLRVLRTPQVGQEDGVTIQDVRVQGDAPPADGEQVLDNATPGASIDFLASGGSRLVGASPLASTSIYVRNLEVPPGSLYRRLRIDVRALTSYVNVREKW